MMLSLCEIVCTQINYSLFVSDGLMVSIKMEPVRIRSPDDPTAGQSNIVVSRAPVQIPESAHVFLLSLMFSKVKETAFVGSETDRFLIAFSFTTILVLKKAGANCRK